MIHGAHVIIYSTDAEKDKIFFREVLKFGHVDVGHGWLIFKLPPPKWRSILQTRMTGTNSI